MNVRLQVMICTHGPTGLQAVAAMSLPAVDGVGYIVSCQSSPTALPPQLERDDLLVTFTDSVGLSNNRNHAMRHVTAPYALVADNDLTLYARGLRHIISVFDDDPTLDIATFRCDYPFHVVYPPRQIDLWRPYKGYNVTSFEIAMRMSAVRDAGLSFDPLLGLGAPVLHAAEENVFLLDARHAGLRGRFIPVTIASHPDVTTGYRADQTPGMIMAQGAYIVLRYPWTAALRLPLKAWRTPGCAPRNLWHLCRGALYALRHLDH